MFKLEYCDAWSKLINQANAPLDDTGPSAATAALRLPDGRPMTTVIDTGEPPKRPIVPNWWIRRQIGINIFPKLPAARGVRNRIRWRPPSCRYSSGIENALDRRWIRRISRPAHPAASIVARPVGHIGDRGRRRPVAVETCPRRKCRDDPVSANGGAAGKHRWRGRETREKMPADLQMARAGTIWHGSPDESSAGRERSADAQRTADKAMWSWEPGAQSSGLPNPTHLLAGNSWPALPARSNKSGAIGRIDAGSTRIPAPVHRDPLPLPSSPGVLAFAIIQARRSGR